MYIIIIHIYIYIFVLFTPMMHPPAPGLSQKVPCQTISGKTFPRHSSSCREP